MELTTAVIQRALSLPNFDAHAAHYHMLPTDRSRQRPPELSGHPRVGGVLLLLYPHLQNTYLALTRRRDDLNAHAGQISFPGGRQESGETAVQAALRETEEEIGVPSRKVTVLGELTSIYIPPSDFEVHPFVGWVNGGERPFFTPEAREVAEILEVPITHLLDPNTREVGPHPVRDAVYTVPYYNVYGHRVWGATAIILSEFLERLRLVPAE
ncbi:NUDIX hydrolase [Candidatus Leptofilum sp.]|uniref:NUDIX hydrolase n=1 Tax=Candidatus Leptofilum sp. TaxID=3241576 RepID=UPI003B5B8FD6